MARADRDRLRSRRRGKEVRHTKKWAGLNRELVNQLKEAFGAIPHDGSLEFRLVLKTAELVLQEEYKERHPNDWRAQSRLDRLANKRKWDLVHLSDEKQEALRIRSEAVRSAQGIVGRVARLNLQLLEKLPVAKAALEQESAEAEAQFRAQFSVTLDERGEIRNSNLLPPYYVLRFTYKSGWRKGQTYTVGVARCPEEAEEIISRHRRYRRSRFWAGISSFRCEIHKQEDE